MRTRTHAEDLRSFSRTLLGIAVAMSVSSVGTTAEVLYVTGPSVPEILGMIGTILTMVISLVGSNVYRRLANLRADIDAEIEKQAKLLDTPPHD